MLSFSKSKYCEFCQCHKATWLRKYKPEVYTEDESALGRKTTGNEVGDLAMQLFGDYVETTTYKEDGKPDLGKMVELTKEYIAQGKEVICEASFDFNGLYCAVDILRKTPNGYAIYEVKSSTHPDKYVYVLDISYQKYVLEKCGVNVTGTFIVNIDSSYVFDGKLDLHKLFMITDMSEFVNEEIKSVESNLAQAELILAQSNEPNIGISENCSDPYDCGFYKYCSRDLPLPSVFDLYKLSLKKKFELYNSGVVTFKDVLDGGHCGNVMRKRQVEFALKDLGTYIEKDNVKKFLDKLSYPLYFLDFETMQLAVPQFVGTRPYQQIPFQYSLHYVERENGELKHKEFLAESGVDPRRALAERLVSDIPTDACVLAYNKSFECSRINELAETFPDLRDSLKKIENNIIDLIEPFRYGYYYNRAMGGSFSIKSVLPAIFPDDPSLDYHNLEGVHNGGEAMDIFPKIKDMPADEQKIARHNLLKYCELDTFAMVKIWQELVRVAK